MGLELLWFEDFFCHCYTHDPSLYLPHHHLAQTHTAEATPMVLKGPRLLVF